MHAKLLIDAIMRQTTVLIAQLSAAAGIRAPLAHLADEVFLNLSQELENQGVGRKVVADMFGMALRGYQRRVQRLRESQTEYGKTLWQAMAEFLHGRGQVTRLELLNRFDKDDPDAVAAVLSDLVRTGLISKTGSGSAAVFAPTPEESRQLLARAGKEETISGMVWLDVCHHPRALLTEISGRIGVEPSEVEKALSRLCSEGQLRCDEDGSFVAEAFVIPVGADAGWEVAVLDHFRAMAGAIAAKLRHGVPRSLGSDTTGGATLGFEVSPQHPLYQEVMGLLSETRKRSDELWDAVEDENRRHPIAEEEVQRVVFYFGQFVKRADEDA
jgi:hypothetical protein